jgi:hypothetical protein
LHRRNGPLIRRGYGCGMDRSASVLRLLVAVFGALTVLLLLLPVH